MSQCWGSGGGGAVMSNESVGIYQALERFNAVYKEAHPYLSIFVCVCGVILNMANIVVLSRPAMASNPINALLTIIALADAAVMTSYVPFAVWSSRDLDYCAINSQSRAWAYFVLFNSCLTVICHAVSIWLTVAMALIRAITVRKKGFSTLWKNKNSYALSAFTFCGACILYIPGMVSYDVVERQFDADYCRNTSFDRDGLYDQLPDDTYIYYTAISEMGSANRCLLLKSAFWINGVVFKMVPCVLLTVFIGVLLHILTEVKQRKTRLRLGSAAPELMISSSNGGGGGGGGGGSTASATARRRSSEVANRTDRTTLMLVVLLAVFLVAELPQGLLLVSTGLAGDEFRIRVFMNLGTLTDLLSLLNSAVNFVIYCAMSQKFREIFCQTILPSSLHYRHFCDGDPNTTTLFGNSMVMAMRNRTASWIPHSHRNSMANATDLAAATQVTLNGAHHQNGAASRGSLSVPGMRRQKRTDSEASTTLLRTPGIEKKKRPSQ